MKRHPSLIPISREHRKMLMLAQLLKKNAPPYKGLPTDLEGKSAYAFHLKTQLIDQHWEKEEKRVFPFFQQFGNETLQVLIEELKAEHQELEGLFEQLHSSTTEAVADQLGRKLEAHIRKEERIAFELAQEVIGWEKLEELEK